ncbi:hypothetical protein [Ponticoccus sp. (in: a-proteobacteria)]|uniref:hypothetical protein n=1 Tax=Ponticoccus sp. (in: a-proteobacteria) TaxID=1925025 RepID=UPI003AB79F2B
MMISKADFEDLFPHLFPPEDKAFSVAKPKAAGRARRDDDGARAASVETAPQGTRHPPRNAWPAGAGRAV